MKQKQHYKLTKSTPHNGHNLVLTTGHAKAHQLKGLTGRSSTKLGQLAILQQRYTKERQIKSIIYTFISGLQHDVMSNLSYKVTKSLVITKEQLVTKESCNATIFNKLCENSVDNSCRQCSLKQKNLLQLSLLREKSGAILLVLVSLMASMPAVR